MQPPAWLARLARDGAIPRGQITGQSESILTQLQALGLVTEQVQGSRPRVVASNPEALSQWITATYPPPGQTALAGIRAGNIARRRQSKMGLATHDQQPLLMRWFSSDPADLLATLTQRLGLIGLSSDRVSVLQPPAPWTLLTVENWESFMRSSYTDSDQTVVVAYTGGNLAEATIRGLASIMPAPQRAVHFGDYDWSGLAIYRRIRVALPALQLYVPDDITDLFRQFAHTQLILNQLPLMPMANDSAEVRQVIALIARSNAGLEQEIVPPPRL